MCLVGWIAVGGWDTELGYRIVREITGCITGNRLTLARACRWDGSWPEQVGAHSEKSESYDTVN